MTVNDLINILLKIDQMLQVTFVHFDEETDEVVFFEDIEIDDKTGISGQKVIDCYINLIEN